MLHISFQAEELGKINFVIRNLELASLLSKSYVQLENVNAM